MKTLNLLFLYPYQSQWLINETFNLIEVVQHNYGADVVCERFGQMYIFQRGQVKFN